jgi:hypothetical protein
MQTLQPYLILLAGFAVTPAAPAWPAWPARHIRRRGTAGAGPGAAPTGSPLPKKG